MRFDIFKIVQDTQLSTYNSQLAMHHILYIDTTDKNSHLILMNKEEILSYRTNENQSNHGQVINIQIQAMLNESSIQFEQLNSICVLNGPGSYTGLRISLSTAKGICYAKDIPLLLIHKLDLLRVAAVRMIENDTICTIIKARENEYFSAFYFSNSNDKEKPILLNSDELKLKLELKQALLCFEDSSCEPDFDNFTKIEVTKEDIQKMCFENFSQENFADLVNSEPFYLKNVHINKINKL